MMAAARLAHWEIIDYASDAKSDGAQRYHRELAETWRTSMSRKQASDGVPISTARWRTRGVRVAGVLKIHSIRLPSFVGPHRIVFSAAGRTPGNPP